MRTNSLFDLLDLNHDNQISRSELLDAAEQLGWHWHEAPILALLDLLTIGEPITRKRFAAIMHQIEKDPRGPYGKVLLTAPHFSRKTRQEFESTPPCIPAPAGGDRKFRPRQSPGDGLNPDLASTLKRSAGKDIADEYRGLLDALGTRSISVDDAALLVIDPQRSFTAGTWMQPIGAGDAGDVAPIAIAFNACAEVLDFLYGRMEIMFTRCPFPPASYGWDDRLAGVIDSRQLYFIKPGNSVLFPPGNGFREWAAGCLDRGRKTMVIGGCTLNSCVRVSAIETMQAFKSSGLRVVVDLSICGARLRNYRPSPLYGGHSAAASAVDQMKAAGVQVVRRVEWQ